MAWRIIDLVFIMATLYFVFILPDGWLRTNSLITFWGLVISSKIKE